MWYSGIQCIGRNTLHTTLLTTKRSPGTVQCVLSCVCVCTLSKDDMYVCDSERERACSGGDPTQTGGRKEGGREDMPSSLSILSPVPQVSTQPPQDPLTPPPRRCPGEQVHSRIFEHVCLSVSYLAEQATHIPTTSSWYKIASAARN